MKKIKQFVYYGENDPRNNPNTDDWTHNLFFNEGLVSQLGIQGSPGVLFCLNHSSDNNAISIGATGVYELDLEGLGHITGLRFLKSTLDENYSSKRVDTQRKIIVDFICEGGNN